MARYSNTEKRWIFNKETKNANICGTLRVPFRVFSGLMYLNPNMKWVITYDEDGNHEFYEGSNGIAEYDTQQDAASALEDIKGEHPNATNWTIKRHPLSVCYPCTEN